MRSQGESGSFLPADDAGAAEGMGAWVSAILRIAVGVAGIAVGFFRSRDAARDPLP